jgi:glutamate-ammonia-ligase adenylyltransferase
MRPAFAAIPFLDPVKAEANLARLEQQLAPTLLSPLASLLAESPDPDGALNLLERCAQEAPADVLGDLARYPTALTYLVAIFGYSAFLAETFLVDPGLAVQFARDRNFTQLKSKEDLMQDYARFATTSPDHWLSAQLARFKRRNYLRIVLKDVLHLSTLGETTSELSALADVILANALLYCDQELEKRYGQPQYRDAQGRIVRSGFSIISLGKLGGSELNYSSDIDLLFLYSHDGETAGGSEPDSVVANHEYFIRLAHAVTRTITQMTPQGQVFRVDLRLRPEGDQGDLAISLKSTLEYYEHRARDWELQMLIKARHSAGDPKLTREFLREVELHIYGAPTDFEAIESVLWAREKISQRLRESRGHAIDVKRHRGGIRDIEFLTQCLQRLHGGRDSWVRSGGTLFALRKLNDKGWLSDRDYALLSSAYEYLRKAEHRIQLEMGHQTHRLPADREALDRLARRVGVEAGRGERPADALLHQVQEAFAHVDEIYQRVVHPRVVSEPGSVFDLKPSPALPADHAPYSFAATLSYLDAQAPELARMLREVPLPERARKNATRFFAALLASSERFEVVRQQPQRVRRALEVLAASEYLGELLIRHPEEVTALDAAEPVLPEAVAAAQTRIRLEPCPGVSPLAWATDRSLSALEKMALLRRHFRAQVLGFGAADVAALGSVFGALNRWSLLAMQSIATALSIAAQALDRNLAGVPEGPAQVSMIVLGLGRLGLNEFDLGSDADLVFVAAPGTARDDMAFCTRLAEKTIEVLSSYTRDGALFAVDTRLRPRGHEGELVVTADALVSYIQEAAHAWEALTYLKACPVAGSSELAQQTISRLSAALLDHFGPYPELAKQLQQMRRRLEKEVMVPPSNTKTAAGGYYDIDFVVSHLRLRHRVALPAGANVAEQIAALRTAGLLSDEDAQGLSDGAAFLRSVDHAVRLVTGRAADGLPEHVGHAEAVENLARRWGLLEGGESLAERLRETQQQVRSIYRRVVGGE